MIPVIFQGKNEYDILLIEKQNISQSHDLLCYLNNFSWMYVKKV